MRIPSGKTDQKIFFVAVDATDYVTRETGLSAFTVYRSRNGATATVYTTPTIAELSSANMPGVYSLLIDEDTTIASGSDSEEYSVHITCTGMAPITRTIELYRREVTTGETLVVASGVGNAAVQSMAANSLTASALAADAVDEIFDELVMGSNSLRMLLRGMAAALIGKADGLGTSTAHYRNVADTMNVITATVDADGNRTAVTLDLDDTP